MKGEVTSGGVQTYPALCANPRLPVATPMCCASGWQTTNEIGHIFCNYQGERVTYDSATAICAANGEEQCQPYKHTELLGGPCASGSRHRHFRSWASVGCSLKAKIDLASGEVAIVVSGWACLARYRLLSTNHSHEYTLRIRSTPPSLTLVDRPSLSRWLTLIHSTSSWLLGARLATQLH